MAKQLYSISAGPLQWRILSPRRSRDDSPKARAEKSKASCMAQRLYNQKLSYVKLEQELAANFPCAKSALVATLTIRDADQPKTGEDKEARKTVEDYVKRFRGKMNRRRKKRGLPELVAFWCIEVLTDNGRRWHVHMALNNTGEDYELIREAWKYGDEIEIEPLRVDEEKNWESLARYMTKEARECQDYSSRAGLPSWSHTRNIKKPERESVTVGEDYTIEVPEDAILMADEEKGSESFPARVIKFRYAFSGAGERPHAKRRKRRRAFI